MGMRCGRWDLEKNRGIAAEGTGEGRERRGESKGSLGGNGEGDILTYPRPIATCTKHVFIPLGKSIFIQLHIPSRKSNFLFFCIPISFRFSRLSLAHPLAPPRKSYNFLNPLLVDNSFNIPPRRQLPQLLRPLSKRFRATSVTPKSHVAEGVVLEC
ncbi:hypothetical protein ACMFMF_011913 [Clarireedia jacksonii]